MQTVSRTWNKEDRVKLPPLEGMNYVICNVRVNSSFRINGLLIGLLDMIHTDEDFVRITALSRHIAGYAGTNQGDRPIPSLEDVFRLAQDFSVAAADEAFEESVSEVTINEIPTVGQIVHDPSFGIMVMPPDWATPN